MAGLGEGVCTTFIWGSRSEVGCVAGRPDIMLGTGMDIHVTGVTVSGDHARKASGPRQHSWNADVDRVVAIWDRDQNTSKQIVGHQKTIWTTWSGHSIVKTQASLLPPPRLPARLSSNSRSDHTRIFHLLNFLQQIRRSAYMRPSCLAVQAVAQRSRRSSCLG